MTDDARQSKAASTWWKWAAYAAMAIAIRRGCEADRLKRELASRPWHGPAAISPATTATRPAAPDPDEYRRAMRDLEIVREWERTQGR